MRGPAAGGAFLSEANGVDAIDLVVFDVDGVLVDARDSYNAAARRTVERVLGPRDGGWLSDDEMAALRVAGGFNDEWDVAAVAIWAQAGGRRQDLRQLARSAKSRGGGVAGAVEAGALVQDPPREVVLKAFCEIYAGTAQVEEMYGFAPSLAEPQEGLWRQERRLVEAAELLLLRVPKAVYTGRTLGELRPTFARFGFGVHFPENFCLTGDGPYRKPDGRGLRYLGEVAGAAHVLMIGDNVDDFRAVENARGIDSSRRYDFCGIEGGALGELAADVFQDLGVEAVAPSASELLRWLRGA